MALVRFNKMLSWNPFSKTFWKSENWSGALQPELDLVAERRALQSAVDDVLPDCIKDMVMMSFPDDPVFSPYGHCFDRSTLTSHWQVERGRPYTTCPFTMRPLHRDMLLEEKHVPKLFLQFNAIKFQRKLLLDKINNMNSKTRADVMRDFENFKILIESKKSALQEQADLIVARDRINLRKEHWQIDKSSTAHLQIWHQKKIETVTNALPRFMQSLFLMTTGHEVIRDSQERPYVIPKGVAMMMRTAEQEYKSTDEFVAAIKKNIKTEKSSTRPHLWCASRSKREQALLDADDMDRLDIRKIM